MIISVQKAMNILSVLSDAKNSPVTLMQISRITGYPKPTCAHILETLCNGGYARRVSQTEGYRLGPSIYYLARYGRYGEELISLARPVMRRMERDTRSTVVLSVIENARKYIIDYADTEQNLFEERERIRTDDIYRTATGRAILAHMDELSVREIYEKYGNPAPSHWEEVKSYESLLCELKKLKEEKIIVSGLKNGRMLHSTVGFASPLFKRGVCVGAIGLAWRSEDGALAAEVEQNLRSTLLKGSREIQRRLFYED